MAGVSLVVRMSEEPKPTTTAGRFADMAERVSHNLDSKFGGAFVIVPPENGGEPMEALILDTTGDPVQFYMLLQAKISTILEDLGMKQRQQRR